MNYSLITALSVATAADPHMRNPIFTHGQYGSAVPWKDEEFPVVLILDISCYCPQLSCVVSRCQTM